MHKKFDILAGSYSKFDSYIRGNYSKSLTLLLVSVIGILPGLVNLSLNAESNFDLENYYVEVSSLIRYLGNFEYPYINPDFHFGFFNAYYPLADLIPSILTLVTGNIFLALGLSRALISLFSALAFYTVCRYEKVGTSVSLILVFLYTYNIYFLVLLKGNISWAGAFIFTPLAIYSLYKVFYGEKNLEALLIFSFVGLALMSLATFVYIIYFFIIYVLIFTVSEKNLEGTFNKIRNVLVPFLLSLGLSSFYLLLVGIKQSEMAFNALLPGSTFAANPEFFTTTGIDFRSLFYSTEANFTTVGILPFILVLSIVFLRPFPKISDFEQYLFVMFFFSIFVSLFPRTFAYIPIAGNTEFGFRALVIGIFPLIWWCKYAVRNLTEKYPFILVLGVVILGTFSQLYFTPETAYVNKKLPYSDDYNDFYSIIQGEKGVIRVNYYNLLYYPLCGNCIEFGAHHNRFAIARDGPTTNLWISVDFAQRNPGFIEERGILGEKYLIIKRELNPAYIQEGYRVIKDGNSLSLLENPYSTSILQFISGNISRDLTVYRDGSRFKTSFDSDSDGLLLIKFAYHPLAEALDNGEKMEIKEKDSGIMYAELKKGHHDIIFRYRTYDYYYITLLSVGLLLFYYRRHIVKFKNKFKSL